jgi:hypothetical protein
LQNGRGNPTIAEYPILRVDEINRNFLVLISMRAIWDMPLAFFVW